MNGGLPSGGRRAISRKRDERCDAAFARLKTRVVPDDNDDDHDNDNDKDKDKARGGTEGPPARA
jgi:hypothetical protein